MNKSTPQQRYLENQAIEWLVKLNKPGLSDIEIDQFNDWLNQSPGHQLAYIKAEQIWTESETLMKSVATKSKSVVQTWRYAFASVLIILCVSLYQFQINRTTDFEFYTGIGEQKTIDLADGSKITLNNQSHLKFTLGKKIRRVELLAGEVLFNVKADVQRPFDIATHDGMVRVLGTKFSVNRYSASTLVTVIEGRVALGEKPLADDGFIAAQVLTQSQQQSMTNALKNIEPQQVDVKSELAWQEHRLIVRNEPLRLVLADLEKAFPVKFVISTPELSEKRITAILNLADLDQVLLVLETSLSLSIERTSTEIRLSEK